jgi:hypothetical protein
MRPLLAAGALLASLVGAQSRLPAVLPTEALAEVGALAKEGFTLGVLRRDATIVPFATYDGKRWESHWPQPSQDVDVPINLRSLPGRWWGQGGPLEAWQVWAGAAPPQIVHVRQPDWLQTHCQKQVGLRTDYQPNQWPPGPEAQPYPKDGLAVSPPHAVEPIETLPPESAERPVIAQILGAAFAVREEDALDLARRDGSPVRASKKELEALPITIEALYAFGTRRRVYWTEAVREYKKANACAIVFGEGWFVLDSGKLTHGQFQVLVVPCSRDGLHYMLPLGVISLPRGQYWIAQLSGWDNEEYDVIDIRADPITSVLAVWGGGC